jgi:hypothetical protein
MAQVLFTSNTTPSLANLDANFKALYGIRELISTPSHGTAADGTSFGAYTASNVKMSFDASFNLTYSGGDIRVSGSGSLLVTGSGGAGYGAGSGGTVTQITSKSTTVSLNKMAGQVTMHSASLASGASVSMQVNNSLVSLNDTVVITVVDDFGTLYDVRPAGVWTGYFAVRVTNTTGGALAHAVRYNFAVLKGAVS